MEEQAYPAPDLVVARADALMQRQRPTGSSLASEADELPVLTEIVPGEGEPSCMTQEKLSPAILAEAAPAVLDPAVLNILAHELARRLEERLASELPELVDAALETALAGLAETLRQSLAIRTEAAIHDFLAERSRLSLLQQQR